MTSKKLILNNLILNGGKGSGNHAPGEGRGVGKPHSDGYSGGSHSSSTSGSNEFEAQIQIDSKMSSTSKTISDAESLSKSLKSKSKEAREQYQKVKSDYENDKSKSSSKYDDEGIWKRPGDYKEGLENFEKFSDQLSTFIKSAKESIDFYDGKMENGDYSSNSEALKDVDFMISGIKSNLKAIDFAKSFEKANLSAGQFAEDVLGIDLEKEVKKALKGIY